MKSVYTVTCCHCRVRFNALECIWCNCIANEPTIVCPGCLNCFCKSAPDFMRRFWDHAPEVMWDKASAISRKHFVPPANSDPSVVKHPLILIVDPNTRSLCVTFQAIRGLGYGTILATDGYQGYELAQLYEPELIVTETLMPRLDGREMCKVLKESPETARIKIVIASELYKQHQNKEEALEFFHADEYLNKPISFHELRRCLTKHLDYEFDYEILQTVRCASF